MEYGKTILAMIGLVLIGFFAGFFTHQQMTVNRFKKIASFGMKEGFKRHLYRVIEATEEQQQILDPIVEDHATKIGAIHQKGRQEHQKEIAELHNRLEPHLNDEQIKRLKKFSRRFRRNRRGKSNEGDH